MACIKKFYVGGAKIEMYNDFVFEDKKSIKNNLLAFYNVVWKMDINDNWFYSLSELDSLCDKGYILID